MLVVVLAHQAVKPWLAKWIMKLIILGLGIAIVQAFFRKSNLGGIAIAVLLVVLVITVQRWRRRRKKRHNKKSSEQHIYHHYPDKEGP